MIFATVFFKKERKYERHRTSNSHEWTHNEGSDVVRILRRVSDTDLMLALP